MSQNSPRPRPQRPVPRRRSIERGRSRDVSPVAIARRASEERRSLATSTNTHLSFHYSQHHNMPQAGPSKPILRLSSSHSSQSSPSGSCENSRQVTARRHVGEVGSNGKELLQQPSQAYPQTRLVARVAVNQTSSARRVTLIPARDDSESSNSSQKAPLSLQEQMQEAYAAEDMLRARILYLKIKGIDVASDDDPRINEVRDEDFVFVPGGELVLDEESLAAMKEAEKRAKEQRTVDGSDHRWRTTGTRKTIRVNSSTTEQPKARSTRNEVDMKLRVREQFNMSLSPSHRREQQVRSNVFGRIHTNNTITRQSPLSRSMQIFTFTEETQVSALSLTRTTRPTTSNDSPYSVSYQEVLECTRGPLFRDSEVLDDSAPMRTLVQTELLHSLLQPEFEQHESKRSQVKGKETHLLPKTWTGSPAKASYESSPWVACSLDSTSTISRTNSWASCSSQVSVSTVLTSPPTSPVHKKIQLPIVSDVPQRQMAKQYTVRYSGYSVPLSSTPLMWQEETPASTGDHEETIKQFSYNPERRRRDDKLVSRVKQSVSSILDFASRVQQSYIRTIQFAVPVPIRQDTQDQSEFSSEQPTMRVGLKPVGFRVKASDVKVFAPRPDYSSVREPLFPSEHNWPLVEPNAEPLPPRVFTPIAFVPPSPLRPRYMPLNPEWRLRPVANPVTLRLKALQNVLGEYGVPWEGRAHAGSLGCGRDKLTGVAFEGLGGSRLAFEVKIADTTS